MFTYSHASINNYMDESIPLSQRVIRDKLDAIMHLTTLSLAYFLLHKAKFRIELSTVKIDILW